MNKKIRILEYSILHRCIQLCIMQRLSGCDFTSTSLHKTKPLVSVSLPEQYLAHVYSYLPREYEYLEEGSAVPRSDMKPCSPASVGQLYLFQ